MGFMRMNPAPDGKGHQGVSVGYEHSETLSGTGAGNWVLIPNDAQFTVVTLRPDADGKALVEATTDLVVDVMTDNDVVAVPWKKGEVGSVLQDSVPPVTAVRAVVTAGTGAKFTVRSK